MPEYVHYIRTGTGRGQMKVPGSLELELYIAVMCCTTWVLGTELCVLCKSSMCSFLLSHHSSSSLEVFIHFFKNAET